MWSYFENGAAKVSLGIAFKYPADSKNLFKPSSYPGSNLQMGNSKK